ncbi:MAG: T9SS type A sorting domain-containing protein [Prolixibacteraceae bacterium]
MKNFTLKALCFLFLGLTGFSGFAQEWNFSNASFSALGTITATTTVDGLTIAATADAAVTVDANNKSLDGMDFTSRLKLGGSGTFDTEGKPVARVISFPVTGNTTITVMGMSSSSSADRQLIVAAGANRDTVGIFPALGTPISKGEFTYTGGPTTIYLYSPASGVNLYYVKSAAATAEPVLQEWNISSATLSVLGTIAETKTVEGLTIAATADATVVVDANNKSLEGMDFTSRLKLGGSGTFDAEGKPVARVLSFNVAGNTTITVMGMSSSSSADRELVIAAGNKETELGRFAALGASISLGVFTYIGDATTIYIFSPSSGVNIYYLKATPLTTSTKVTRHSEFKVFPNPATGRVFINLDEPAVIGIYSISGQLVKQQMVASSKSYINISDLHAGVYFVKAMNTYSKAQKLIIQ